MITTVFYDDASHTYYTEINGGKSIYTSATTLVGMFKQPFDKVLVAANYAAKNGGNPEEWIKKWEEISKEACDKGTKAHNLKEQELLSSLGIKVFNTSASNFVNLTNYHTLEDGVYPELKLWHHDWRIAGRSDKCIIETVNGIRFMHIEDYKTNKELKQESYKHPRTGYKMMKKPIQHLMDCNMVHYHLQLSIYQYMAEYLGFKPGYRKIIHIPNDETEIEYHTPYLRREVMDILQYQRTTKLIK